LQILSTLDRHCKKGEEAGKKLGKGGRETKRKEISITSNEGLSVNSLSGQEKETEKGGRKSN